MVPLSAHSIESTEDILVLAKASLVENQNACRQSKRCSRKRIALLW